jgi:tRNA U34 2-thiouridine synthase MnmA/TrmU
MKSKKQKAKALVLFSGGLDSRLVICLLKEQGVDVQAIHFKLPFGAGCCTDTMCNFRFSQKELVNLRIIDCTKGKLFDEFMKIVIKPKHGHGSGMNPCIDCRIFLLKKAKEIMKREKFDFIATGEVLNERPMSQHRKAMDIVESETGLEGYLLRPLSAKLLPETIAEQKKLVDRSKLLSINGRSRKIQMSLAAKYGITYPSPGGGCLLCEKDYCQKLNDMLKNTKKITEKDIELLRIGRHFRYEKTKIIVGRNHNENLKLLSLKSSKNWIFEIKGCGSPITVLYTDNPNKQIIEIAASLTARYADCPKNERIKVQFGQNYDNLDKSIMVKAITDDALKYILIIK